MTRAGGPVLIDRHGVGDPWRERIWVISDPGPGDSMLLRPDCYLAWTSAESADALAGAIERWFSAPAIRAA